MGDNATEIDIFNRKLISFTRMLPLGGIAFTRAISDTLGHPMDHAERLKKEMAEIFLDEAGTGPTDVMGGPTDFSRQEPTSPFGAPAAPSPFDFTPPQEPSAYRSADMDEEEGTPGGGKPPIDLSEDLDLPEVGGQKPVDLDETLPTPAGGMPPALDSDEKRIKRQIFDAMVPVLGDLVTELRRSLDYYRSRSREGVVHRLILCGGMARLKNLAPFLQGELGIPVEVANPLQHLEVGVRNLSREYLNEIAPLLPVAVGLAVRDMIAEPARPRARKARA
jgi:type IV pilus assembly protein PilM